MSGTYKKYLLNNNMLIQQDLVPAKNPKILVEGRLSDLRIILLTARLPLFKRVTYIAVFVPDHGNGWHVTDFHHLSFYPGI